MQSLRLVFAQSLSKGGTGDYVALGSYEFDPLKTYLVQLTLQKINATAGYGQVKIGTTTVFTSLLTHQAVAAAINVVGKATITNLSGGLPVMFGSGSGSGSQCNACVEIFEIVE